MQMKEREDGEVEESKDGTEENAGSSGVTPVRVARDHDVDGTALNGLLTVRGRAAAGVAAAGGDGTEAEILDLSSVAVGVDAGAEGKLAAGVEGLAFATRAGSSALGSDPTEGFGGADTVSNSSLFAA